MRLRELVNWERPESLTGLQKDMNRLFDRFSKGTETYLSEHGWGNHGMAAANIVESREAFRVEVGLPGMDPEAVEVSVTGGFLTVKGERKEEREQKDESYLRHELSFGSVNRRIALPATADCDRAEASFRNGVLTVKVPKKAEAIENPRKLEIKKAA